MEIILTKNKTLISFLPFMMIFYNLKVFSFMGKIITLSDVLIIFIVLLFLQDFKMNARILTYYIFTFLFVPLISSFIGLNFIESVKSVIMLLAYSFIPFYILENKKFDYLQIIMSFINGVFVLSLFALVQFIIIRVLGILNHNIVYPFGDFTAYPKGMLDLIYYKTLWRSNSFLLEPSVLGVYITTAYYMHSRYFKSSFILKVVLVIALLTTRSTVAYIIFFGSFVIDSFFGEYKKNTYIKSIEKLVKNKVVISFAIIIILLLFSSVFFRIFEVKNEGTSGFIRFIPPFLYSVYVLYNIPFGIGIGTTNIFIDSYHVRVEEYFNLMLYQVSSIDNIVSSWIISYGILSIIFFVFLWKSTLLLKNSVSLTLAFIYFMFYLSTGTFNVGIHWILMIPFSAAISYGQTLKAK